jgi:hypothetical protein
MGAWYQDGIKKTATPRLFLKSAGKPRRQEREIPMKLLIVSAFAAVALLAAATVMLRSPPTELSAATAAMPSLQELHTAAGVNKLPIEDFEDQSLVFSTATKR